ncbi:MAG TPA: hypothetical protein VFV40_05405 [Nocardioides sp.]|nr:hypothetical protein [Nocardioides sp.]
MSSITTVTAGILSAAALTLVTATPALANDDDVIRRGSCTGATDWKLKASPEDGRIEVEGEVDSNRNGQTWRWRIVHNGSLSARGSATTKPPSGSFEVRRLLVDAAGTDTIVFRARNPLTDEVCRGVVRY